MALIHHTVIARTIGTAVALGLAAGFSPGPLLALTISQTLTHGTREGMKVAFVPFITDVPIMGLSLVVLSRFASMRPALGIVTLAGALFVAWLGIQSLGVSTLRHDNVATAAGSLRKGVILNALSPHPYIFWISVGIPFVIGTWPLSHTAGAIFPACFLSALAGAKIAVATAVGRSRRLLDDTVYSIIMKVLGVVLFVLAVILARNGMSLLSAG